MSTAGALRAMMPVFRASGYSWNQRSISASAAVVFCQPGAAGALPIAGIGRSPAARRRLRSFVAASLISQVAGIGILEKSGGPNGPAGFGQVNVIPMRCLSELNAVVHVFGSSAGGSRLHGPQANAFAH